MMRAAFHRVVLVCAVAGCGDSRTSTPSASTIDPHVGREVPLEYRMVFNQPKLALLRADGADDAQVRVRWAEAMSRLGSIAELRAEAETLVITYSGSAHDRICAASEWAKLYDLPELGFRQVRCATGDESAVPDDSGLARRRRSVEHAHQAVAKLDVGLVWHEREGLVVTAIVEHGRCSRGVLAKLVATIRKAGINLRADGFEKIACSVDPASLDL